MKRILKITGKSRKILAGSLVLILSFLIILTGAKSTLEDLYYDSFLDMNRHGDLIYEKSVKQGTTWDHLGLPLSVRGVAKITNGKITREIIEIEHIADNSSGQANKNDQTADDPTEENPVDIDGFHQMKPAGEDANYELYGYVAPKNENELRENGRLVIYTHKNIDGSTAYRVYGTYQGANKEFYACDANGTIIGIVEHIHITWDGVYNGDIPDTYILTAEFVGYTISGKKPSALVTVLPDKSEEKSTADSTPPQNDTGTNKQRLIEASSATYTIDLSTLVNGNSGPGWNYASANPANSGTTGSNTITFNSLATDNEYIIVRNTIGGPLTRDIVVQAGVNNVTIRYDGANIKMNKVGIPSLYHYFNSNVTIQGGENNSVLFDKVVNLNNSTVNINSGAKNTTIEYKEVSHKDTQTGVDDSTFTINNNNGALKSSIIFDDVDLRRAYFNQNSTVTDGIATMRLRGANTFNMTPSSFQTNLATNSNFNLFLSGSSTINGYFAGTNANITIDSESSTVSAPASEKGTLALTLSNSFAGIGSKGLGNSGDIIINGGTINVTQNGDGGAAIGSGLNYKGIVAINGGKVTAKAVNGAAIGGGSGNNGMGDVTINNGLVNAVGNGDAAAIGGGANGVGDVKINGGNVTATISNGQGAAIGGGRGSKGIVTIEKGATVNAKITMGNGAAIGGGRRTTTTASNTDNGCGEVTINGGNITTDSRHGASIGGGGGNSDYGVTQTQAGISKVTIADGNLNLKSFGGACIGVGGNQLSVSTTTVPHPAGAFVTITGGTIFADFNAGDGVGTGQNNTGYPEVRINAEVDILAFGRAFSNFPGINCGDGTMYNKGTGHYVNLNLGSKKAAGNRLLVVYDKNNPNVPVRVAHIPYDFYLFSYTTGTTIKRTDYVYTGNVTDGLTQLRRAKDKSVDMYSVKKTLQYDEDGMTPPSPPYEMFWRSLYVEYGQGAGFAVKYPVNEHHVDLDGELLPIPNNPGAEPLPVGSVYDKHLHDFPEIPGYVLMGYQWDTKPNGNATTIVKDGNPKRTINKTENIYYVYKVDPGKTDVTISKMITGVNVNKTRKFTFTVSFEDNEETPLPVGKTFDYIGGVVPDTDATAPDDGSLELIAGGHASFTLQHGQMITIENVPADYRIKVTERSDKYYEWLYTDNEDDSDPGDEEMEYKIVGTEARVFDFENTRIFTPPTGIEEEGWLVADILLGSTMAGLFGVGVAFTIWKRKRL